MDLWPHTSVLEVALGKIPDVFEGMPICCEYWCAFSIWRDWLDSAVIVDREWQSGYIKYHSAIGLYQICRFPSPRAQILQCASEILHTHEMLEVPRQYFFGILVRDLRENELSPESVCEFIPIPDKTLFIGRRMLGGELGMAPG